MCAGASTSVSSGLSVNFSSHSRRSCKWSPAAPLLSLFLLWSFVFVGDPNQFSGAIPALPSNTGLEDELDESSVAM